jgi:hypothetical protein
VPEGVWIVQAADEWCRRKSRRLRQTRRPRNAEDVANETADHILSTEFSAHRNVIPRLEKIAANDFPADLEGPSSGVIPKITSAVFRPSACTAPRKRDATAATEFS